MRQATHSNNLQRTATRCNTTVSNCGMSEVPCTMNRYCHPTHCNKLQPKTLQYTSTQCNVLNCKTVLHAATHCNILPHDYITLRHVSDSLHHGTIHVSSNVHAHTHTHTYTHKRIDQQACVHAKTLIQTLTHTNTHKHTYTQTHVHTNTPTHAHTRTHTHKLTQYLSVLTGCLSRSVTLNDTCVAFSCSVLQCVAVCCSVL